MILLGIVLGVVIVCWSICGAVLFAVLVDESGGAYMYMTPAGRFWFVFICGPLVWFFALIGIPAELLWKKVIMPVFRFRTPSS